MLEIHKLNVQQRHRHLPRRARQKRDQCAPSRGRGGWWHRGQTHGEQGGVAAWPCSGTRVAAWPCSGAHAVAMPRGQGRGGWAAHMWWQRPGARAEVSGRRGEPEVSGDDDQLGRDGGWGHRRHRPGRQRRGHGTRVCVGNPTIKVCCSNLKYWKVEKSKSFERWIGIQLQTANNLAHSVVS